MLPTWQAAVPTLNIAVSGHLPTDISDPHIFAQVFGQLPRRAYVPPMRVVGVPERGFFATVHNTRPKSVPSLVAYNVAYVVCGASIQTERHIHFAFVTFWPITLACARDYARLITAQVAENAAARMDVQYIEHSLKACIRYIMVQSPYTSQFGVVCPRSNALQADIATYVSAAPVRGQVDQNKLNRAAQSVANINYRASGCPIIVVRSDAAPPSNAASLFASSITGSPTFEYITNNTVLTGTHIVAAVDPSMPEAAVDLAVFRVPRPPATQFVYVSRRQFAILEQLYASNAWVFASVPLQNRLVTF
jgi:hypothetical protein